MFTHGGNLHSAARRLGCAPSRIQDASASLIPFSLPWRLRLTSLLTDYSCYPDVSYHHLRDSIGSYHSLPADYILPGNGASELITWAARDAAAIGISLLPSPTFADYLRALRLWSAQYSTYLYPFTALTSYHDSFICPQDLPGDVIWITNPHNPTGHLWTPEALQPLLDRFRLVIVDESFLPIVNADESLSVSPLVVSNDRLIVLRSLTKAFAIPGLRFGYAIAAPDRLRCWQAVRDPWPVNAIASQFAINLLDHPSFYLVWLQRLQAWSARERSWLTRRIDRHTNLQTFPSSSNFFLVHSTPDSSTQSLEALRVSMEVRYRILLRTCTNFDGLGSSWLRISLSTRHLNERLFSALRTLAPA